MFEKGPNSAANLWVCHRYAERLLADNLTYRFSPAQILYETRDGNDRLRYGRHSALRPMRQLGDADLICFNIQSEAELEQILAGLAIL